MDISASIVTYKTPPAELDALLCSFQKSTIPCQVIVVDNSPTAQLRLIAEAHDVEYVKPASNIGFGAAHNLAMGRSISSSHYHLIVNPDIRFDSEVISELARFMEAHPMVGLAMPKVLHPDGEEQSLCKRLPSPFDLFLRRFVGGDGRVLFKKRWDQYELRELNMDVPREIPCLSGCFMFLRSEILKKVGGFDERYFMYMEDVDLCRRIAKHTKTIFYPLVSVEHGYAKGSYKNWRLLRYHLHSAFKYFCKWGWIFDSEREVLNARTHVL